MGNQHKNQSFNIQEASRNNLLGEKLAKARKEQKIRQGDFVRLLKDYGIDMSSSSYSCWETGARTPNAYQLLALCRALDIDDVMGYFLDGTIRESGMDLLNEEGQKLVKQYIHLLAKSGEFDRIFASEKEEAEASSGIIDIRLYNLPVSAGTGEYLDSEDFEVISFPEKSIPAKTDFAVRVHGDSMEPAFYNNQLAFIQKTLVVNPGDIGIFIVDGESYIKKYGEELPDNSELEDYMYSSGSIQKKPTLISLNDKYPSIHISRNQDFIIVGKVLNRTGYDYS